MIRNLFGGASKCRTIDKVDIFGDSSGVALYQLDGNANDTGGSYHGTETAITYGGGVYERGAVFNGATGQWIGNTTVPYIYVNLWVYPTSFGINDYYFDCRYGTTNGTYVVRSGSGGQLYIYGQTVYLNATTPVVEATTVLPLNQWSMLSIKVPLSQTGGIIGADSTPSSPTTAMHGMIDQVRLFNRDLTATERATLYAECAPTSIVDNINPFMDGSLKALYQFDGDATDATGVYNGTATNVTYGTGKFGQCAVFSSTATSKVSVSIPNTFGGLFSLSWTENITTQTTQARFGSSTSYGFLINTTSTGAMTVLMSSNGTSWDICSSGFGSAPTVNTNNHYAVTRSGTTLKMYLNGVLLGTNTIGAANPYKFFEYIGNHTDAQKLNGSIDQVRFFNKALTPMEVASLYSETTPLEEPMYKLVDPFRDGSGKALYRLEGNALDESGNYNGTATSVTYGVGRFGRCGVFNGSAYYTLSMATSNNFSISSWIKTTADSRLFGFDNSSGRLGATCVIYSAAKYIAFVCTDAGGIYILNCSTPTIPSMDSNFHHVVCTFDGINGKVYFDGALVHTATSTLSVLPTQTTSYLGRGGFTSGFFNGSIDQTRYFNRALTAGEVSTLYTNENNTI